MPFHILEKLKTSVERLKHAQVDLFFILILKWCESYNYFSLSRVLVLFLTEDFGFSDIDSGLVYGAWGTLITAYGVILGGVVDKLGVKRSLILSFFLSVTSRFIMASTKSNRVLLVIMLLPASTAGALGVPVLTIGIKRYTDKQMRGFAFSLFYSVMNLAALFQGLFMDVCRRSNPSDSSLFSSGNRLFIASGCVPSTVGLLLSFWLRDSSAEGSPDDTDCLIGVSPMRGNTSLFRDIQTVVSGSTFWRFMVMCLYMVNLRNIFLHLDATLPKYQLRAFGPAAPIGFIYSINPAVIILLVPIIGALTAESDHFSMIHVGSWISSLSPFCIVLFDNYWSTALFVLVLSLGEALWSPRWYDYTMSVAPLHKEGLFTSMASAPLFIAQLPTGVVSGALLSWYCPEDGHCDGRLLWLIIGVITMTTPVLLCTSQRCVRPRS